MMIAFADRDECLSVPCQNDATCTDLFNAVSCTCGWMHIGDFCEISKYRKIEVAETPQFSRSKICYYKRNVMLRIIRKSVKVEHL